MSKEINRRQFIKTGAALSAGTIFGPHLLSDIRAAGDSANLAVVEGKDFAENTRVAIQLIGGIKKYIPADSNIAILANPQHTNPGSYTKPDIVRAVIQLCKQTGANRIGFLGWLPIRNWRNTGIKKVISDEAVILEITNQNAEEDFEPVNVPAGVSLKQARLVKTLSHYDVLINIAICKEHSGDNFSGSMKNLMGLNSPKSDQTFHKKDWTFLMDDMEHLDQCIADLNTIIHPVLTIVDATEFLLTNGPFGPGQLGRENKVIAGVDRVAIDAYCTRYFGLRPDDSFAIIAAHQHGLGQMDLSRLNIKEVSI